MEKLHVFYCLLIYFHQSVTKAVFLKTDNVSYAHEMCKYQLHTNRQTWNEAFETCRLLNMSLAKVTNKTELTIISDLASDNSVSQFWIGLSFDGNYSDFVWDDCDRVDMLGFWEPNFSDKMCVKVDLAIQEFVEEYCNTQEFFVCEKPASAGATECFEYNQGGAFSYKIKDFSGTAVASSEKCGEICMTDPACVGVQMKMLICYPLYKLPNTADGFSPFMNDYYGKGVVSSDVVFNDNKDVIPLPCTASVKAVEPLSTITGKLWYTMTIDASFQIEQYQTSYSMSFTTATAMTTVTVVQQTYTMDIFPTKALTSEMCTVLETGSVSLSKFSGDENKENKTKDQVSESINIEESIRKIKEELMLEPKELSLYKRKFISVKDSRPSATTIGVFGIGILVTAVLCIILLDLPNIIRGVSEFYKHIRKCRKRFKSMEIIHLELKD